MMTRKAGKPRTPAAPPPPPPAAAAALLLHEDRLRKALSLGLLPCSSPGRKRWWNTDAQVQGQAARAILAFVTASKSSFHSVPKSLLEDMVSALEGLLFTKMEQVYSTAAEATAALVMACGNSTLGVGVQALAFPLVRLLLCPRSGTVASCAIALRTIIDKSKSRSSTAEDDFWKALKDADVQNILASKIQNHSKFDGEGGTLYVAIADLFTAILRHWPSSRFSVGQNLHLRMSILLQCTNMNEIVSCAALRVCAALALCGGLAVLQLQENEGIWPCLVDTTNLSKSYAKRIEAFRVVASLSRSHVLRTSISLPHADAICRNITDAIAEGLHILNERWPPDVKVLVWEASQAARDLLRVAGKLHLSCWRAGLGGFVCELLVQLYDARLPKLPASTDHAEANHKPMNYDRDLGPVLWDILGWLAVHAQTLEGESLTRLKQQEAAFTKLVQFACTTVLQVANRKGFPAQLKHLPSFSHNGLDGISICKAVLFLLFSPSHYLASITKHGLTQTLQQHTCDGLPSFVSKLSVTFSSAAASEDVITLMSLMAIACLSKVTPCRHQLLEGGVLDVLIKAIQAHPLTNPMLETTAATNLLCNSLDVPTCCWQTSNFWEGHDPILFFSLWAFASLARGSHTAMTINSAIKKRVSEHLDWNFMPDGEFESHLLFLAGSTSAAPGLQWLASCCLASCGAYGFPSQRKQLSKVFNDSSSADLKLVFADGSCAYAHKVIMATKCPDLLPSSSVTGDFVSHEHSLTPIKTNTASCQVELNLSARIRGPSMQAVLEFIYKGFVLIDEELVSEVKLLAKRCQLETLTRLLQGKFPVWGSFPDTCDFIPALGSKGCIFSDITLEDKDGVQVSCITSAGNLNHLHAHRAILSSQCSYFEGLFRSGMLDSFSKVIKIPLGVESLKKLLHYLYCMNLPQLELPEAGCMWSFSNRSEQIKYLKSYVELAQLAEQWLLEDLKEQCLTVVQSQLKNNVHLAPEIMSFASSCEQWAFVEAAAECISSDYPRMRDSGELDALEEYLIDAIRAAHVNMSMNCSG